jgi:hypothetical protein
MEGRQEAKVGLAVEGRKGKEETERRKGKKIRKDENEGGKEQQDGKMNNIVKEDGRKERNKK